MAEPKFCVDCRHFDHVHLELYGWGENEVRAALCLNADSRGPGFLVTGRSHPQNWNKAFDERMRTGACGPEGRLWAERSKEARERELIGTGMMFSGGPKS